MTEPLPRLTDALSDRYRLERELGQGGMATVYLAQDLKHDRKVAVKVLRPELAAVIGAERFLSEIKTTANLQHPHILPLFDSGESDGFLYYVMPFVEGETIRDRMNRDKQFPVGEAVRIATEVAGALDYAHRHNVIHRDIKPENILLHDGRALVADFGIALAASKAGSTRMTETGMSLGTPHYMSPEQAMGERDITARSDVYALGCVLYEMLTGEPPFTGATAQAIVARVLTEHPRPMLPQRHTIPPQVEAAVLTSLEKLPADRFATAAEFAAALADTGYASRATLATAAAAGPATRTVEAALRARGRHGRRGRRPGRAAAGRAPARARTSPPAGSTSRSATVSQLTTLDAGARPLAGRQHAGHEGLQTRTARLWVKRRGVARPGADPGHRARVQPGVLSGRRVDPLPGRSPAPQGESRQRRVRHPGRLGSVSLGFGGATWLDDGTIVYVPQDLNRMHAGERQRRAATTIMDNSGLQGVGFGYPTALPGARGVLFEGCTSGCVTMSLRVLDLRTGQQKLLDERSHPGLVPPDGTPPLCPPRRHPPGRAV